MRNAIWIIAIAISLSLSATGAQAANTLVYLNAQRAHMRLPAFGASDRLQQAAEYGASEMARRRMTGHLRGRPLAGRKEGTARRSSRQRGPAGELWGAEDVFACYQNVRDMSFAGCASVLGADGYWYYCVLYDTRP